MIYNHLINNGLGSSLRIDLLTVSVVTNTRRWGSDTSALSGTNSDNLAVDGARHTVVDLDVELWKGVLLVDGSLGNVTNGGRLDHVSDGESLDGLVLLNFVSNDFSITSNSLSVNAYLRNHTRAVGASHRVVVASALLVSTVGGSLLWHFVVGRE